MNQTFIWYFILINIITFVIRGIDKSRAIKSKRRISENTLLTLTAIGGFLGGILGMQLFHHKTIKSKFLTWFWFFVIAWIILIIILLYNFS